MQFDIVESGAPGGEIGVNCGDPRVGDCGNQKPDVTGSISPIGHHMTEMEVRRYGFNF